MKRRELLKGVMTLPLIKLIPIKGEKIDEEIKPKSVGKDKNIRVHVRCLQCGYKVVFYQRIDPRYDQLGEVLALIKKIPKCRYCGNLQWEFFVVINHQVIEKGKVKNKYHVTIYED